MSPRTLDDWLAYVSAQHPSTIALGLDRVRDVWKRMQIAAPPVTLTVGGTNGKGSTCAFAERILLEAGYRVGLYTSPHILRYNERVRVQGEEVDDAALVRSFEQVERARGDTPLTYFEFGTLGALGGRQASHLETANLGRPRDAKPTGLASESAGLPKEKQTWVCSSKSRVWV